MQLAVLKRCVPPMIAETRREMIASQHMRGKQVHSRNGTSGDCRSM